MILKVEWVHNTSGLCRRVFDWDDDTVTDEDEIIEILEAGESDKVKRISVYEPEPQYLTLYTEITARGNGFRQRLILRLSPDPDPEMDGEPVKIADYGISVSSELIFDSVRSAWYNIVEEVNGNMLYFEEFKRNAKGECVPILLILEELLLIFSLYDSEDVEETPLDQILNDAWAEWID
jgi:hypothetical protein